MKQEAVRLFPAGRIFIQHKCRIVGFLCLPQILHPHIFLTVNIVQFRIDLKQMADKFTVNHLVCAVDRDIGFLEPYIKPMSAYRLTKGKCQQPVPGIEDAACKPQGIIMLKGRKDGLLFRFRHT